MATGGLLMFKIISQERGQKDGIVTTTNEGYTHVWPSKDGDDNALVAMTST